MAEGVTTADGRALGLDPAAAAEAEQEFARAMAAPREGDPQIPPRRAHRAAAERDATPPRTARPPRKPRAAKAAEAPPAPARQVGRADIVSQVSGIVTIPAAGLALVAGRAARRGGDPTPWLADAVTLAERAERWGAVCADTAEVDERFAAVMAKVCAVGPYAAILALTVETGAQLARNHGLGALPGTVDPAELVAEQAPVPVVPHDPDMSREAGSDVA